MSLYYAGLNSTQWKLKANLLNVSNKTIVAYEVLLEARSEGGARVRHTARADYFLRPKLHFGSGAKEPLDLDDPVWQTSSRKGGGGSVVSTATVQVSFVEFSDGSKFGTSAWGEQLSSIREHTAQQLESLVARYQALGEDGLRQALADMLRSEHNSLYTRGILRNLQDTLQKKGSGPAFAEIKGLLDVAKQRRGIM